MNVIVCGCCYLGYYIIIPIPLDVLPSLLASLRSRTLGRPQIGLQPKTNYIVYYKSSKRADDPETISSQRENWEDRV